MATRGAPSFVHEAQLFGHGESVPPLSHAGLGYSMSVSGTTAVVGAPFNNTFGPTQPGSAYVFVHGLTWTPQQQLVASDGALDDRFGTSVSVSGDTAVVAAYRAGAGKAYVFVRSGTTWTEQQKLEPPDASGADFFGVSVSISGDTVLVGSPFAAVPGYPDAGAAYVFVRSGTTWTLQQKLIASDPGFGPWFGNAVSLSGDTAVVGAQYDDPAGVDSAGSAYVFVRSGTTWTQEQKIGAADPGINDQFGSAVSVHGDTAVVGAAQDDVATGSAYVFVRSGTNWTQQQKLTASDAGIQDFFGFSVGVSGNTALIGANADNPGTGFLAGSAYVFVRSGTTWTEQQKLAASDGAPEDVFGHSVAIDANTALIGAPQADTPAGIDAGAAYTFFRSGTWFEGQKLTGTESQDTDYFGVSVSVFGDTAVVGAHLDDLPGAVDAGSAYVFVRSGTSWVEQHKLVASDAAHDELFGWSVSISGDTAVVGARYGDTAGGTDAGSAYVFVRNSTAWVEQQKLVAPDGSSNDDFGISVSVSGDTVVVGASGNDTAGNLAGAAYVFVRSGTSWTLQQKLLASDGAANDIFGNAVSIAGDTAVVGAVGEDSAGTLTGAAYVFVRSGGSWTEQQKLMASDAATQDLFAQSLSVSGDTVVVGAPGNTTVAGIQTGSAYVFERTGTTWTEQQNLLASDASPGDLLGWSVTLSGEAAVVGAVQGNGLGGVVKAGSAYVFLRTGTIWAEQQKLVAPDGATFDAFGASVSLHGGALVVGAYGDDTSGGVDAGSVHVFRKPQADLSVTKTDGQTTVVPGEPLTYTITVSNGGPDAAAGASVADTVPAALQAPTWTCSASQGSSCTASGSGSINDTVDLPVNGTVTYLLTGTIDPAATGTLANTATVTAPGSVIDPNPGNNSATDIDALTPEADLAITKTDSVDPVFPGDPLTYVLTVANGGASNATAVTAVDTLPAGVTFVSSAPGPPTCTLAGVTLTCDLGPLAAGASATVTINVTVDAGTSGMLVNTATVSGSETDPDPRDNTASATTAVGRRDGELAHGTDAVFDLAALPGPVADEDVYRIEQKAYSSYEVVVDATSGDIGAGNGPLLERIGPDGTTVIQSSVPVGAGPSRSLRWANFTPFEVEGETIRVRSAQCTTDCGPDDVYRIRAYETTYSISRFNNTGSQVTVLIFQNTTDDIVGGVAYFRSPSGTLLSSFGFGVSGHRTVVVDTTTVPGLAGMSGSITVANSAPYGMLSGKAVALEPATGFSFDSPLVPRVR